MLLLTEGEDRIGILVPVAGEPGEKWCWMHEGPYDKSALRAAWVGMATCEVRWRIVSH